MSIPDYQSLMMPVLQIAAKGETSVPLAEAEIAAMFALSQEEHEQMLPSGKQRVLHNRIHWAKFYLTKAGYLEAPRRGRFMITPAGTALLAKPPAKLDTQYLLSVPVFRDFYRADQPDETVGQTAQSTTPTATPEEVIEAAFNATQGALRTELLERILQNGPGFFGGELLQLEEEVRWVAARRDAAPEAA